MRTNRIGFILLACLLVVLAGWLLGHRSSNPQVATPSSQTATAATTADSIPVTEAVTHSTPPREVRAEPVPARLETSQTTEVLTNSASPIISQDLDQNREWARNFPGEALAWLTNAPDGQQRLTIAEIAYSQVAQTNVVAAVKLAENYLSSSTNEVAQFLLDNLTQQWADQDLSAARAWALAKPAGEQRDRLLQRIAMAESAANPAEAGRLISEQMSPGQFQNEAAISVIYQWAQKDAAAAMAWAESFPAGELRDRAIKEVKNVSAYAAAAAAGNPPAN